MTQLLIGTAAGVLLIDEASQEVLTGQHTDWVAPAKSGWWVLTDADTLWFQPDHGPATPALQLPEATLRCLLPTSDEMLIGAAEATLLRIPLTSGPSGPSLGRPARDEGFSRAPGRSRWYTPWGGPPDVRSITIDAGGAVYVNVHVGGIPRQAPGTTEWRETIDIDADVHQVLAHSSRPGVVVAATARGLALTGDGGETWEFRTDGLHATYCRAVALAGDTVFVSASAGPGGTLANVYRGDLGGGALEQCKEGLPDYFTANLDTGCLVATQEMVVAGDASGVAYESLDFGRTWRVLADQLAPIRSVAVR